MERLERERLERERLERERLDKGKVGKVEVGQGKVGKVKTVGKIVQKQFAALEIFSHQTVNNKST